MKDIIKNICDILCSKNINYEIHKEIIIIVEPHFLFTVDGNKICLDTFGAKNAVSRLDNLIENGFMDSFFSPIYQEVKNIEQLHRYIEFGIKIKDCEKNIIYIFEDNKKIRKACDIGIVQSKKQKVFCS